MDLMLIIEGCKELELLNVSSCLGFDAYEEMLKKASWIERFVCGGCKLENSCGIKPCHA
ncbi:hypothetical protein HPP92_017151 [Vanilla planifolia]|uniref:Uncharacterized protein n=1 Tax=Vanilla planifolia TaxID=51239 RepID=A0A835Q4J7_VANPL|nr:hypothetical protein HPP92_017741 [Vanilla planifolia]KAG0467823.1 hypothetical protein HPP92_017151 [Vanilla planifolia]